MNFDLQILSLSAEQNATEGKEVFFQQYDFILHQGFNTCYVFSAYQTDIASPQIQIKFILIDTEMVSLPRCPYGGFKIDEGVSALELSQFFEFILNKASSLQVDTLLIKQQPEFFEKYQSELVKQVFGNHLVYTDINQHIDIPNYDPEESLHKMQRRRVLRCLDRNFSFKHEKPGKAKEIHEFISMARTAQGIKVNIPEDHFIRTIQRFPYHYDLFTIQDDNKIIAATVTVKTSNQVVYNYLPASDRTYSRYSPMVFLITKLIAHYDFKKFLYFDMGISSIEGKEQENLRGFKKRLGGIESSKNVFEVKL